MTSDSVNAIWNCSYDAFNRLSTAVSTDGRGCSEVYDRSGTDGQQNSYNGTCYAKQFSFWDSNDRIDGWSYDALGNLFSDEIIAMLKMPRIVLDARTS